MQMVYKLTSFNSYTVPRYDKRETSMIYVDYIDIYTFHARSIPEASPPETRGNIPPSE